MSRSSANLLKDIEYFLKLAAKEGLFERKIMFVLFSVKGGLFHSPYSSLDVRVNYSDSDGQLALGPPDQIAMIRENQGGLSVDDLLSRVPLYQDLTLDKIIKHFKGKGYMITRKDTKSFFAPNTKFFELTFRWLW